MNFSELNPKISLDNSPFYINTQLSDWPTDQLPRRASVSAFGVGGTNAHMVLQQAPLQREQKNHKETSALCFISARSRAALQRNIDNLIQHCRQYPEISVHEMAFTLRHGRETHPYQALIVAENINQFIEHASRIEVQTIQSATVADQHLKPQHNMEQSSPKTRRIPLPTYSWDLKRYWIEADKSVPAEKITQTLPSATENDMRSIVKMAWKKAIGVEPQSDDDHFFNQGGHSLAAIHFVDQLPVSIRESIQVMHIYQYPKFLNLLRFIESQYLPTPFIHDEKRPEELFADGSEL